jgi:AcrR family transcriptional regulator
MLSMPKYVDHEMRRHQVATIAADLVATGGVDALTVRNVAVAAGCSTAIISHYFTSKRDLVLETFRAAAARATARFEAAATAPAGHRLQACLETLLPLDEARRKDYLLWCAFWGIAASDPELSGEQRERVRSATQRVAQLLTDAESSGRTDRRELGLAAAALLAQTQGIGLQAVFDPQTWKPARQRRALRRAITTTRTALAPHRPESPAHDGRIRDARN